MIILYIFGMIMSVLYDLYWFFQVKKGVEVTDYPTEYLKYSKYQLFRSWVMWSLVWPILLCMTLYDLISNRRKS